LETLFLFFGIMTSIQVRSRGVGSPDHQIATSANTRRSLAVPITVR
jgi:hypothetical protein